MHLRKLTTAEKIFLRNIGLNPNEFLKLNKDAESYTFCERQTGRKLVVRR